MAGLANAGFTAYKWLGETYKYYTTFSRLYNAGCLVLQGYNTYITCKEVYKQFKTLQKQDSLWNSKKQVAVFAVTAGAALVNVVVLVKLTDINYKCYQYHDAANKMAAEEKKFMPLFEKNNPKESWVECPMDDDLREILELSPGQKIFMPNETAASYATPEYNQARGEGFAHAINLVESQIDNSWWEKANAVLKLAKTTLNM